jgi:predicted nucleotidyltransferase
MNEQDSDKAGAFGKTCDALRALLPELREQFHVKSLGVFGSTVRGEAGPESDLDLLVEFDRAPSFFRFVELEQLLTSRLGVTVDLVLNKALKPRIGARVLAEVVSI